MNEATLAAGRDAAPYTCYRTRMLPAITGLLKEAAWQNAPKSSRFGDMETGACAFLISWLRRN